MLECLLFATDSHLHNFFSDCDADNMKGKIAEMNLLTLFLVLVMCVSSISCQEEGSGESAGGHDQPAPDQQPPTPDNKPAEGEAGADPKKKAGEQGYTQGFNQGVKPYSYGYNTGIKPYSYNFYQPLGGKPQVVEQGGPDAEKKGEAGATANKSAQPSPPPLPAIDFPAVSSNLFFVQFVPNICHVTGLFSVWSQSC